MLSKNGVGWRRGVLLFLYGGVTCVQVCGGVVFTERVFVITTVVCGALLWS